MRNLTALLVFVAVIMCAWFGLLAARPSLRNMSATEVIQVLLGDTKDSLRKEKMVSFSPPDFHYRISFPGTPSELNTFNMWLHQTILPVPCYFMADKDLGFYASETQIGNEEAPGRTVVDASDRPLMGQPTGNNEAISQNAQYSVLVQIQEFLDAKCSAIVTGSGATLFSKIPAASGGGRYPGRIVEGTSKTPNIKYRLNVFYDQDNKRLFAVCVVGKPEEVQSKQANSFLQSLDIHP